MTGVLSRSDVTELVGDTLWAQFIAERGRLKVIDDWARGRHQQPWTPKSANPEYRDLMRRATTPTLRLIVAIMTQATIVDGYRSPRAGDSAPAWKIWQANGFDSRQVALHRGVYALGQAFVTVLPGQLSDGSAMPTARAVSALKMYPVYQDPAEDEWPMYALRADASGGSWMLRLIDDEAVHYLSIAEGSDKPEWIEYRKHNMGVCPVTRFANELDLDGRTQGEVEPFIPLAMRIDQVTADRLMVQRFASWKIRTVSGMAKPETKADEEATRLRLRQDDILIAANEKTKFGTLDETPLDGFIQAGEADMKYLAAASQTPPQTFSGDINNVSAEGIAMTLEGHQRKLGERHATFGESHEQWLGLAAASMGAEMDPEAQIQWRDVEARSLGQLADAFGKVADQLHFPAQILWDKLPFLTQTDIEEAKRLVDEGDSLQQLLDVLDRQRQDNDDDGGGGAGVA